MFGAVADSWAEALPHVLPVIRGATSPTGAWRRELLKPEAALVRQAIGPALDVLVVLDLPDVRVYITVEHLRAWGVSNAEVLNAALGNLPPTDGLRPWTVDGVWHLEASDGYGSSRLVLPGWLAAFSEKVRGRPIALVPDGRTILITGADSGLPFEAALRTAWDQFHAAGNPVSLIPWTIDESGVLIPFEPPLDHPLVHRIHACQRMTLGHEYRRQDEDFALWEELHGEDVKCATYTLLRHASGRVVSFARVGELPCLIPWVDLVVFGESDNLSEAKAVRFQDLRDCGSIGPAIPGLSPNWWPVTRAPSGDGVALGEYQPVDPLYKYTEKE